MAERSTKEVIEDHLRLRQIGDIETDLARNYDDDSVIINAYGIFHGREGIRMSANILAQQLANARYYYRTKLYHKRVAYLEWSAESSFMIVGDGADSYFIEDGVIKVQTIHYHLESR